MRISELYLKAYGPFTEERLDLSENPSRLQVIFGPNEAGKSSALRALRDVLYGIPVRSTDNFVHDHRDMRVGARLRLSDERELSFLRRKGSKRTLRSYDDAEALEDSVLYPFVDGVPQEVFTRFFGIDHQVLVEGGQSLLDHGGELGKSLFAAGLGSGNLRTILSRLEAEEGELFKSTGSKPRINAKIGQLKQLKTLIKQGSLKGRDWQELDRALAKTEKQLETTVTELRSLRTERTRLERLRTALPLLARRHQHLSEIAQMGEVVQLDESFETRLETARDKMRTAIREHGKAEGAVDKLNGELEPLSLEKTILQHREAIEHFRDRLGSYNKAREDLPRREGERDHLKRELAAELGAFQPGLTVQELDELGAPLSRRREIQSLANEHGALALRLETAIEDGGTAKRTQENSSAKLENLPEVREVGDLRHTLKAARDLGDVDSLVTAKATHCERAETECDNLLMALPLWSGELEELERLPVPEMETIEVFHDEFEALRNRREKSVQQKARATTQIREAERQLESLRKSGAVPTEADLVAERSRRDLGWALVRRSWLDKDEIETEVCNFAGDEPLPEAYEHSVERADTVSDRLRREADRVASQATLVVHRDGLQEEIREATEQLEGMEQEENAVARRWRSAWEATHLDPNSPREMLAWWRRHQKLLDAATAARRERDELRSNVEKRRTQQEHVLTALAALGEPLEWKTEELAPVLIRAEETLGSIEAVESERTRLRQEIDTAKSVLEETQRAQEKAEDEMRGWFDRWQVATEDLGVGEGAPPVRALDRLDMLSGLFEKKKELGVLDHRIDTMKRDIDELETDFTEFVAAHALQTGDRSVEQRVLYLKQLVSDVDQQETLRARLEQQRDEQNDLVEESMRSRTEAERELEQLRKQASSPNEAGLEEALRNWKEHRAALDEVAQIEDQLVHIGNGISIEQFEADTQGVDRDALPGVILESESRIEELEAKHSELTERRSEQRVDLARMDGSADAAQTAEEAQEVLASLGADVTRYVRIHLAHAILRREIERYRKEHQAPLLVRASDFFAKLTLGSFARLESHDEEDGVPQLVGLRPPAKKARVSEMSSGTRDQLFLALRLATLEGYLDRSEPMPFVVDDILVNFDDERTRAALELLAKLSERTQVLLFTHHGGVREQAMALEEKANVLVLEPNGSTAGQASGPNALGKST